REKPARRSEDEAHRSVCNSVAGRVGAAQRNTAAVGITVLSQLHLSNPRCLSHSSEHALPNVHPEVPTPVCPPNIAAAKAACRGIILLARQFSLRSGAV